jgi:hypothetical protein
MIEFAGRENRMFDRRYTTAPLRVALSLMAGSAAYAIMMVIWGLWGAIENRGIESLLPRIFPTSALVFAIFFVLWSVVLLVFGFPLGLLLHKLRLRHWSVAFVVGGAMTFLVALALATRLFEFIPPIVSSPPSGGPPIVVNPINWWGASRSALILGAGGAVVAMVMWRIAYRRAAAGPA